MLARKELLQKAVGAISTSDMPSLTLNPEQFREFLVFINEASELRQFTRQVVMSQKRMEIPRLFFYEPITEPAKENASTGITSRPVADKVELVAKKLKSAFDITTDALLDNVQGRDFERTVLDSMLLRCAVDLEYLAINGDTAIGGTDRLSVLLSAADGWAKLALNGHTIDWRGGPVTKELFAQALRRLPDVYKSGQLAWIVSKQVWHDWMELVSSRATAIGDEALQGRVPGPFGIPMIPVSLIRNDLPLTISTGLPAELYGSAFGPFEITSGVNDTLILSINGGPNRTVAFAGGVFQASQIAAAINAVLQAAGDPAIALDDGEGRLVIRTTTTGAASSITVQAGSTAAVTLGIQGAGLPNQVVGVAPGAPGQLREGSFILLTDPRNLIWGIFDEVRINRTYNHEFDRFEFSIYAYVDFQIENLDAIVEVTNVRVRSLF